MTRPENRYGMLICGCAAVFFPGSFVFGFPGVMAAEWQMLFDVDKARIGQLMFFVLAGTGFSMYLTGKLQEIISPHWIIMTGNAFCAVLVWLVSQAESIDHVFMWGFCEGFFCGFVYLPCLTVFQNLFPDKKGLTAGIINLTFGGAAAIMSPLFSFLLATRGYETTCMIIMAAALSTGTVCAFVVRLPESVASAGRSEIPRLTLVETLSLRPFWFLYGVWALAGAAGVSMIMLSATLGQSLGYDVTQYVIILTGFNVLNGIGRLVFGRLADCYSKQKLLMAVFLMAAAAYGLMPYVKNIHLIGLLACFIGLAFGTLFTVSAPLITDCFGLENFGRVFGLVFTAYGFIAGLLGPWFSGIVLERTGGNFALVFTGFSLFYLVSAFLIVNVTQVTALHEPGCDPA